MKDMSLVLDRDLAYGLLHGERREEYIKEAARRVCRQSRYWLQFGECKCGAKPEEPCYDQRYLKSEEIYCIAAHPWRKML